ncbi:MAG: hypothetical protein LBS90_04675, partial [Oscillospiraceae bacterium]|nr:hypothetical protein [Oscillospiraceae bacterium]
SRDELIRLAQKGRDYDRIRGRAESLAGRLGGAERANEALGLLARKRGMTAEQYADSLRAESLAAERGVSRAEAVTLVRRERAAAQRPRDEELAVERQAAAFAAEYPDVDPAAIPGEVWTAAGSGAGLLGAYRRYELQSLRSRVRELETSAGNAARSTGSRASDGGAGEIETDWLGG